MEDSIYSKKCFSCFCRPRRSCARHSALTRPWCFAHLVSRLSNHGTTRAWLRRRRSRRAETALECTAACLKTCCHASDLPKVYFPAAACSFRPREAGSLASLLQTQAAKQVLADKVTAFQDKTAGLIAELRFAQVTNSVPTAYFAAHRPSSDYASKLRPNYASSTPTLTDSRRPILHIRSSFHAGAT